MIKTDKSKGENCGICDRMVPEHAVVLRKVEGNRIICVLCLVEIAEIASRGLRIENERT